MDVYKSVNYCISLYTTYIQSGWAGPRSSRSRSSWRRPRNSCCPAPHQTCRSTDAHGQTSVKWVVLTTTRTHQLIRVRERHHCHHNYPACSAPTTFVFKDTNSTWASTLWPRATKSNGDEKNWKSEAQRCAGCCLLATRQEGGRESAHTLDKREGGRVVKPLVQMTPNSIVLRPTPSPTASRGQTMNCMHFDIYMRGLDDRKARI